MARKVFVFGGLIILLLLTLTSCGTMSVPKETLTIRHDKIQELVDYQSCASETKVSSKVIIDASDCDDGNAQPWTADIRGDCECYWLDPTSKVVMSAMTCSEGTEVDFVSTFFSVSCEGAELAPIVRFTRVVDLTFPWPTLTPTETPTLAPTETPTPTTFP